MRKGKVVLMKKYFTFMAVALFALGFNAFILFLMLGLPLLVAKWTNSFWWSLAAGVFGVFTGLYIALETKVGKWYGDNCTKGVY